jgi:DHA1 family multidrug resistance protein-like MFS transporter
MTPRLATCHTAAVASERFHIPLIRPSDPLDDNRRADRLVRALTLVTGLQWLGASAILPLLPEYLRHRGGSDALVGAVMAAFFAAGVLFQYPAGRLADHIGRRPVLLMGLLLYAGASVAFLAPVSPVADVGLRALQGAGAGAAEVASLAMVSGAVSLERRGRAFGSIYAGQLAGIAIGPLVGSLFGVGSMAIIFVAAGAASLVACLPVLVGSEFADQRITAASRDLHPRSRGLPRLNRSLVGSLVAAGAIGLTFGVYESCWTLLLDARGAKDWQIGLSWSMFAVPFVVMSRPGGWLADHFDRRRLVVISIASSIAFCVAYPFIHSIVLLVVLGSVEAIGVAVALPAAQSLLTQESDMSEVGRVQGLFSTSETGSIAIAAGVGGWLFAMGAWVPFIAAAAGAAILTALLPIVWAPVAGRVADHRAGDPAPETTLPVVVK